MDTISSDFIVENTLISANMALAKSLNSDVLILRAPMGSKLDDAIRDEVELIKESREEGHPDFDSLAVVLETVGGYIETVERIVAVFRRHYGKVIFIVPNFAYSAGTVLALSGDEIYMDYYSVLGPIDPQYQSASGESVPGMGYIAKYEELMKKINNAVGEGEPVEAELAFLLNKFDPAKLFHIDQATQHSRDLIKEWLPKYKFKDWKETRDKKQKVDDTYRKKRAEKIADRLADADHWHSHGRGISMAELEGPDIGLQIENFGLDNDLNHNIRHYYGLFTDYMDTTSVSAAIHTSQRLRRLR